MAAPEKPETQQHIKWWPPHLDTVCLTIEPPHSWKFYVPVQILFLYFLYVCCKQSIPILTHVDEEIVTGSNGIAITSLSLLDKYNI